MNERIFLKKLSFFTKIYETPNKLKLTRKLIYVYSIHIRNNFLKNFSSRNSNKKINVEIPSANIIKRIKIFISRKHTFKNMQKK